MATRQVLDDDGNALPAPDPTSDVGQLIYLLEYARLRGFELGPTLQIGNTVVQVKDLRQRAEQFDRETTKVSERSIWQENGHDE